MKPSLLIGKETHKDLAQLLQAHGDLTVSGASNETAKAMIMAHLLSFYDYPSLLVAEDEGQVETLQHWLAFFEHPAEVLPPLTKEDGTVSQEALQKFLLLMQGGERMFLTTRPVY